MVEKSAATTGRAVSLDNRSRPAAYVRAVDTAAPTVRLGSPDAGPVAGPFAATFTFDEPVSGFDGSDIRVVSGAASEPVETDPGRSGARP